MNQLNDRSLKIAILVFLIILGFIIGFFLQIMRPAIVWQRNYLSPSRAAAHVMSFLQNSLGEGVEVKMLSLEDHYNLYRLKLEIGGRHFLSYATKDGKLLFTEAIDMFPPGEVALIQSDRPTIDLFVAPATLSTHQAINNFSEAQYLFGDSFQVNLRYIVYPDQGGSLCWGEEQRFCSPGGAAGVEQSIRELCLAKYQPDKLWDFSKLINELLVNGEQSTEADWMEPARQIGVDLDQLEICFNDESVALLAEQVKLVETKRPVRNPARYVNSFGEFQTESVIARDGLTLVINGLIYDQGEHLSFWTAQDYQEIFCRAFKERSRPDFCLESATDPLIEESPDPDPKEKFDFEADN